jgi:predicted nucleotidyltransferase
MNKELREEFKKLGILIIYFFGSRAVGRESPLSDVDIGIVLKTPLLNIDTRALYNKLFELFSELYPDSKVDIVFLQTAPLALQFFAIKEGKILWEGDARFTADYENLAIQQYLDFRPVLDIFDRAAEERYAKT